MMAALENDRLARGRATVDDAPGALRISIPARRNWFILAFVSVWLVGWAFGEIMVLGGLLGLVDGFEDPEGGGGTLFAVAWLIGWTLGGGFVLYVVCWQLMGREEVLAGDGRLRIAKVLGPVRRENAFDARRVEDLRADVEGASLFDPRAMWRFWGIGGGNVAFDYGARTHRFGAALDEAEAKQIARRVQEALR